MNWKELVIDVSCSIKDALALLNKNPEHLLIVTNANNVLMGTITDGDIRRGLLKNFELDVCLSKIMNVNPISITQGDSSFDKELMKRKGIFFLPIVNKNNQVVGIKSLIETSTSNTYENLVVLMAGGFGKRLGKITETKPKPLVELSGTPIIEHIINTFISQGFTNFIITLGYKGEMIEQYLRDGSHLGCSINYTYEQQPMGTGGALSLIDIKLKKPFFVMNSDLLIDVNFKRILDFHLEHPSIATMCVREEKMTVPYGVVSISGDEITNISEKPTERYLVNSGIYILNPECLEHIPPGTYFDMTDLFTALLREKISTSAYALHEQWIDIGRPEELYRAEKSFEAK